MLRSVKHSKVSGINDLRVTVKKEWILIVLKNFPVARIGITVRCE